MKNKGIWNFGPAFLGQRVGLHLRMLASHTMTVSGHFCSSRTSWHMCVGSTHPCWRPGYGFWFLTLDWPCLGCGRHLECEPAGGWFLSFFLSLPSLFGFPTSKLTLRKQIMGFWIWSMNLKGVKRFGANCDQLLHATYKETKAKFLPLHITLSKCITLNYS